MAATNFTPIQLYFSTTASAVPTAANLAQGELAINITDGKLYYEDNGGSVQVIATKGAGTIGGSTTQIQYNNAGALAGNAAMVFNNSTNVTTLTTLNLTNALGEIYGGTAQSTYTQGDVLYASAANTLAKLGIGASTFILTSNGTVPQWVAPSSISVLTATNLAGGVAGSVPYQSGVATTTFLGIGAANRVMTSTGTAPQWVTSLTSLTGVSSSSITNTSLTSGRVVLSTTAGLQADDADLTFDGTTLSAGGYSTTGLSTLVKTVKIGDSNFSGVAIFAPTTPAKLYMGTGTVTDVTSAISATNTTGAIASLDITPIAATNTGVTYTNAATLYIAGAPSAGTNITITNPYSLYVNAGAAYFGGLVTATGFSGPLNGTVGATTPTTGAFTTLSATGVATFSAGTAALPAITTSGDTNTGIYFPLADTIAFTEGGAESMRIDSSGNVGIGTSTISSKLDLFTNASTGNVSTITFSANNAASAKKDYVQLVSSVEFNTAGSEAGGYTLKLLQQGAYKNSIVASGITNNSSNFLAFSTTSEAVRIDSSGNVGIGTTSPSSWGKFAVRGNAAAGTVVSAIVNQSGTANSQVVLSFDPGDNGFNVRDSQIRATNNGGNQTTLEFYTSNASTPVEAMRITTTGNVGIGTSSPTALLQLSSTGNPGLVFDGTNQGTNLKRIRLVTQIAAAGDFAIQSMNDAGTVKSTNLYIDSSGNVGIGTSSPGAKLDVSSSTSNIVASRSTGSYAAFQRLASTGQQTYDFYTINGVEVARITGDPSYLAFSTGSGATERMRIGSNGDVGIGTNASAGNTLRYLDVQNSDTGASAGAIIRLITSNAAASGTTSVDIIKYKTGGFYINNNETDAAAFTSFYVGASERMRIDSSGNVLVVNPAGLGYGTGSGGTVTQATSKSTAVTLNKPTGQITMNAAALGATTSVFFDVNDSLVAATDNVLLTLSNFSALNYTIKCFVAAGKFTVILKNETAGSLSEAVVFNFAIIKGATS